MTKPETSSADPAIEALFQEHGSRVFRAAYRVTGSASDAEDVVQTVFLRLLKRPGGVELGDTAGSYLHRAAVNASLDLLRGRRRSRAVPLDDQSPERPELQDSGEGPEVRVESREVRSRFREALTRLNPRAAEVFVLRYVEGYGNTEIAEILETSRSSIGVTLHRSRARLKDELGALLGAES